MREATARPLPQVKACGYVKERSSGPWCRCSQVESGREEPQHAPPPQAKACDYEQRDAGVAFGQPAATSGGLGRRGVRG